MNNSCPQTRDHVHRRNDGLGHVGHSRDCGSARTEGLCTKEDLDDIITEFRRFYRVKKYTAPTAGADLSAWLPPMPVA
jgi:hypothetical protein